MRTPVGGLFRHVRDLARAQAAAGHDVGIVCDASTGGATARALLEELEPLLSLGVTRLSMRRLPGLSDISAIVRAGRVATAHSVDILHGHGAKGGAYARLAPVRRIDEGRVLRVYTPHGGSLHYDPSTLAGVLFLAMERWLLRRTSGLIFESAYGCAIFQEKVARPACPAKVIHNGLNDTEFEPVKPFLRAADILFVGELRDLKGVSTLLEALAAISQPLTTVIVGDGPDRDRFHAQAEKLGLAGRTEFRPPMPARIAFAHARLLVIPSYAESLPYIVLEAIAAGVPLITTRVGGIPEIFGKDADKLVPPGDIDALAGAISASLADPAGQQRLAARLRQRVKAQFSAEHMANEVQRFYSSLTRVC